MKLIVGLGNPGREYSAGRHNVGFRCISMLARENGISLNKRRGRSRIGLGRIEGKEVLLAKPGTYMNLSGEAVKLLMRQYAIPLSELLVIHDDLDIPLAKLRLRQEGSAGGHKGVASIIAALGSRGFVRLRIGIGRPEGAGGQLKTGPREIVGFVLGDLAPEDMPAMRAAMERAVEVVRCLITEGIISAMNRYN